MEIVLSIIIGIVIAIVVVYLIWKLNCPLCQGHFELV